MTQEQKAKAYDEALEWMRKVYPTLTGADKEDAEHYFPELKESEDEKMWRKLMDHLDWHSNNRLTHEECDELRAWLAEQKPADGKELLYVSNKSYNIGYRDGKREAEQKTAEWSDEDERIRAKLLSYFNEFDESTSFGRREVIEIRHWLKSLHPLTPHSTHHSVE